MAKLLIINNAEKGISEFVTPLQNILEEAGMTAEMVSRIVPIGKIFLIPIFGS